MSNQPIYFNRKDLKEMVKRVKRSGKTHLTQEEAKTVENITSGTKIRSDRFDKQVLRDEYRMRLRDPEKKAGLDYHDVKAFRNEIKKREDLENSTKKISKNLSKKISKLF